MDETFDAEKDVRGKILYIESIRDPERLLRHAKSLIAKGCRIAAIKSGSTQSGARATSHHTGSAAFDDKRADELFREAGIVRCYSRQELVAMGCLFSLPRIEGNRFAIITQAGGLGVLTADALSKGGMLVPELKGEVADELLTHLPKGASVSNPIDVLATGTVEQLETVIDYCDKRFDEIDAIILSYGSAGLEPMDGCFDAIHRKLSECRKPVITICPSIFTEAGNLEKYLAKGHVNLLDEELAVRCIVRVAGAVSGSSGHECFG
jgi:acetyltransferase